MLQSPGKGQRDVHLIVGRAGNGKTTLLRQLLKKSDRAIVFDPARVMYPGLYLYTFDELDRWIDLHGDNSRFRLIFQPQTNISDFDSCKEAAEHICYTARNLGNIDIFFDEIDSIARADSKQEGELYSVVNFERKSNISVHGTVRRPQVNVPRYWVTETTIFTVFQTCDPLDLGFIARYTRLEPEKIEKLEQFEYMQWRDNGQIIRARLEPSFC